jgi:uncharacterized spore protein YtfJ
LPAQIGVAQRGETTMVTAQTGGMDTRTFDEAVEASRGVLERTIERVLDRVLTAADVRRVYGEPIRQGDRTIVPVAQVQTRFGFGGGSGKGPDEKSGGEGGGGGGSIAVRPLGYLEITAAETKFVPIVDTTRIAVIGTMFAGLVALSIVRRR